MRSWLAQTDPPRCSSVTTPEMSDVTRGITADHIALVRRLCDVDISTDGGLACVTEWQLDPETGTDGSRLLVVDCEDGAVTSLPSGPAHTRAGRWSPTGRTLALLGGDAESMQLWLWDSAQASMVRLTDEPAGVAGPCSWSPDGRAVVYPRAMEASGQSFLGARAFTITGDTYKVDGRDVTADRATVNLQIHSIVDGSVRTLTSPGSIDSNCTWSPDGRWIAFLSDRDSGPTWAAGPALWLADSVDGSLRRLTDGIGLVEAPAWSPDSRSIAFIANSNRHNHSGNHEIRAVTVDGVQRSLTAALDISFGICVESDDARGYGDATLVWRDGAGIFCGFSVGGSTRIGVLPTGDIGEDIRPQAVEVVSGDRTVLSFAVAASTGRVAFVASDPSSPGELSVVESSGLDERILTGRNDSWLSGVDLASVTRVSVDAADGTYIDAWVMTPPGDSVAEAPALLSVHGGPHWPTGWRFSFENQRLAAQGYVICVSNPRGSQGYGEAFSRAIVGAWGDRDYLDVLAVAEYLAGRSDTDAARIAIGGASYGGYLTCWAIGHSNLFAAAIAENAVTDLRSYALTTADGGAFIAEDLGSLPWEDPQLYVRLSPLTYAPAMCTPLLLVHGERDHNCPINQSEQMYTVLRRHGRDVTFLRIPGEGHLMVLEASLERRRQRWVVLDEFLRTHLTP